jgi:hypothetical protein
MRSTWPSPPARLYQGAALWTLNPADYDDIPELTLT